MNAPAALPIPRTSLDADATLRVAARAPNDDAMRAGHCLYCGASGIDASGYCCTGCRVAHALLAQRGVERFHALADGPMPRGAQPAPRPWLAALVDDTTSGPLALDLQGITCGACVWVVERVGAQHGIACTVNPGIGRMTLAREHSDGLAAFLDDVETLGYRVGPPRKHADTARDSLVLRAGITSGLAMMAMSFSFARYFGLDAASGEIETLFRAGEMVCGTAAVLVGGSTFFVASVRALRMGVVPLDLPVALGIALSFIGSVVAAVRGAGNAMFFDSVAMFTALMVLGRLAQRGALARSRAQLLDDAGLMGLNVTLLRDRVPVTTTADAVHANDGLLVRPGDVVPVSARVVSAPIDVSLAWINGESDPHRYDVDEVVPAGACHVGMAAVELVALEDGAHSRLATLLAAGSEEPRLSWRWQRFAEASVVGVLALAALGGVLWASHGRALEIATAVMVVTCPCALGLALPLAGELASSTLRAGGVYVRRAGFLDRLLDVTHILLDKTGTLTFGTLVLSTESERDLRALDDVTQRALFELVARSSHPKSRALTVALVAAFGVRALRLDVDVHEVAGEGVHAVLEGRAWFVGRDPHATDRSAHDDVTLTCDGVTRAHFTFDERLHDDAIREVQGLQARGFDVRIVSGDVDARVQAVAQRLGITHVYAARSPEQKAAVVEELGATHVLFVGDGVNDAAAFAAAACAGTPALERPQLPARADFYTLAQGLGPLCRTVDVAAAWRRATRTAMVTAVAYNVVAVGLALGGVLTPLFCAVLMPASSVVVVALVRAAFGRAVSLDAASLAPTLSKRSA